MQAKELRIGNILIYNEQTVRVMGISGRKIELGYFTDSLGFERNIDDPNLKPIALTTEILEKAGFVKDAEYSEVFRMKHTDHDARYLLYLTHVHQVEICVHGYSANNAPCQYLHTMQNLYFALTATELNIEL